ncbi:hypothetical protein L2E82_25263 [Cichorium intybus]|uniref:Uncharacterized protein n=1 Tax=Cichorium intybus TaxID=13427 RepID=A0ACB9E362_CICIN|nr:hypothetical protein L2E82_25263 [Cichorium intybus]
MSRLIAIDMWTSEVKKMKNDKGHTNGSNPCEPDSPTSNQVIQHWSWSEALLKRVNSPPLAFPVYSESSISMLRKVNMKELEEKLQWRKQINKICTLQFSLEPLELHSNFGITGPTTTAFSQRHQLQSSVVTGNEFSGGLPTEICKAMGCGDTLRTP